MRRIRRSCTSARHSTRESTINLIQPIDARLIVAEADLAMGQSAAYLTTLKLGK